MATVAERGRPPGLKSGRGGERDGVAGGPQGIFHRLNAGGTPAIVVGNLRWTEADRYGLGFVEGYRSVRPLPDAPITQGMGPWLVESTLAMADEDLVASARGPATRATDE